MRWGIFDIGTRAVRLMLVDAGNAKRRRNESELTHLGRYLTEDGLMEEGIARLVQALGRCLEQSEGEPADQYFAVATSALREAKNRALVLERVHEELGLKLSVLSGEEEAYLSLLPVFKR